MMVRGPLVRGRHGAVGEGRATTGEVRVVTVSDVGGLGGTDSSGEGDGGPGDYRGMPGW